MTGQLLLATSMALLQQATPINSGGPGGAGAEQLRQQIALEAVRHPGGITGIVVPLALFAMIVTIVWLGFRKKQAQIQARAEFHKHLLDKFSSGKEFSEFLESKGSQRFLDELWSQGMGAKDRILGTMRMGVILSTLGLGFLALAVTKRGFVIPGVLVLALGIGYLMAAAVSYRVSKRRGQNEGQEAHSQEVRSS